MAKPGLACADFFCQAESPHVHPVATLLRFSGAFWDAAHGPPAIFPQHVRAAGMLPRLRSGCGRNEPAELFSRSWKTEDGLPDNAVTAVVQTRDGYLWVGTYGGLVRFDGAHFTVFNSANTPALQSDRVTSLFEDAKGTLWIGHERGDLTRYRDGKFESQNVHETGVRRKIPAIGADADGDIWMLNEEGTLVRVRDGATCSLPNTDGVAQLAQDGRGKLWVTSGGQLAAVEHGRLTMLTDANDSNGFGYYVLGICPSRDGGLWIVSDGQVRKWDGHAVTENRGTNPYPTPPSSRWWKPSPARWRWERRATDSICFLSNRAVLHFNHANGFPNDWIRCLYEDREGTLWVGAGSVGLIALRPGKIETLDPPGSLAGSRAVVGHHRAVMARSGSAAKARGFTGCWTTNGNNSPKAPAFPI